MCPSQVGYVHDWSVRFQVQLVSVNGLSGGGVLVLSQDRMALSSSRQDDYSITQDGSSTDKLAVEIHNRMVSRWVEPQSGY